MESTRPIRALTRGLDALTVLNLRDGATVSEVALEIRLPRTTVYRILETLCEAGCVFRDSADDRYRLQPKVQSLSEGFVDEDWVVKVATPCIAELGREIVWPVVISTLVGTAMLVRESTEHRSPLAIEHYPAGFRFGLLDSASGRAFLAHCRTERRDELLAKLAQSKKPQDKPARDAAELERLLNEVKTQGFAMMTRTRRAQEDISIAVPVLHEGAAIAALAIRVAATAMPAQTALERFLPSMRDCARTISARWAVTSARV